MNEPTERLDDRVDLAVPHSVEDQIYTEIVRLRRSGEQATLATVVGVQGSSPAHATMKILVREDGSCLGSVGGGCLEEEVKRLARTVQEEDRPARFRMKLTAEDTPGGTLICGGTVEVFLEPITAPSLVIFGGGHVSRAVAGLAARVGFRILITDDRPEYASLERFPMAAETLVEEPVEAARLLPVHPTSYVVVMTRTHEDDRRILGALFERGARPRYLGMIGSGTKVRLAFEELEGEGVSRDWLRRIRAPVGLRLGARTADEIAVAVVAELVAVRRGHPTGRWNLQEPSEPASEPSEDAEPPGSLTR